MKAKIYKSRWKWSKWSFNIIYYCEISLTFIKFCQNLSTFIIIHLILQKTDRFLLNWLVSFFKYSLNFVYFCPCHVKWTKFIATFIITLIKIWQSSSKDFLNSTFQSRPNFILLCINNKIQILWYFFSFIFSEKILERILCEYQFSRKIYYKKFMKTMPKETWSIYK